MTKGRPKGYSPYYSISYEELSDWVGKKAHVVVCKKWLASLGYEAPQDSEEAEYEAVADVDQDESPKVTEIEQPKIEYTLTKF